MDSSRSSSDSLTDYERQRLIQVFQNEVANNFDEHVRTVGDLANLTSEKLIPIQKG